MTPMLPKHSWGTPGPSLMKIVSVRQTKLDHRPEEGQRVCQATMIDIPKEITCRDELFRILSPVR